MDKRETPMIDTDPAARACSIIDAHAQFHHSRGDRPLTDKELEPQIATIRYAYAPLLRQAAEALEIASKHLATPDFDAYTDTLADAVVQHKHNVAKIAAALAAIRAALGEE